MAPTRSHGKTWTVRLRDGRIALLRELQPDDGPALVDAVAHADPGDLHRRFLGSAPSPHVLLRAVERADGRHDFLLGAFAPGSRLVGVAQFDRGDDRPVAEVAIEVDHGWQRVGLGRAMLDRCSSLARERGVHEFTAQYYADNIPINRLLRRVGHVVKSGTECGLSTMLVDLDESA